ncbi:conserved protein of unknown function [Petrocella atlantisensis]|uniref:Uncharacterized protein n=1 Tax=Petrocella atlantisensis TaxID=2173034 RepID=A0A3P7NTN9_9FIRM|nr:glycosyltransferase [Petrocella atlantisensis]VDN46215.1 conserved protein of unknown function [Petrocella atlantisensis]
MSEFNNKYKIMMHYVMPGAIGGPNILFGRIESDKLLNEKYDFIRLNQNRIAGGKLNIGLILELKREIQEQKPNIIHISGMQSAGFHCMIAAVLAGCKNRLITTHGFSGDALDISKNKRFIFNNIIEPITIIFATHVQGISQYTYEKKMIEKYAKNKRSFIYNLPPSKSELNKKGDIRKSLGIREDEVVFTTISRIVLDKGYKELAKAIHRLRHINGIRFLIVGDGAYEKVFRNQVIEEINDKKVIMLGKRNDVISILYESDVFVLPTLHENLGNVFLEASSVNIPSIGTNVGGVPEVIEDGVTGILVPPYNSKILSESILKLYKNPKLRKEMGENANQRLKSKFNSLEIAKQFDELYSSMLN